MALGGHGLNLLPAQSWDSELELPSLPRHPPISRLTCERVTAMLIDDVSDDMDATTTASFAAHLGNCLDCVAFLKTYRETIRETRALQYEDLPEEMRVWSLQFLRDKITGTPKND